MAAWPTSLPQPIADGYRLAPEDPVIRTDMEVGAPRARRRTSARNDRVEVKWLFTDAQFVIFRDWFDDAAAGASGGAAWFNVRLKIGTGGMADVEARFAGIWKSADHYAPDIWVVTATLEIR